MMNIIFALMLLVSAAFGAASGNISEVGEAAMSCCAEAVELFLYLLGGMCMWGGLMRVAEKAGMTEALSRLFRPVLKHVFKGIDANGRAFGAICMNITANLLGLGNAATPLGLEAMRRLEREEGASDAASRNMIMLVILNTSSITLIPATAVSVRMKHGSSAPMEILPCVVVTSVCALAAGLLSAAALDGIKSPEPRTHRKKEKKECRL